MQLRILLLSATIIGQMKHKGLALLVMGLIINFIMILNIIQIISDVVSYVRKLQELMEFGLQEGIGIHQGGFSLGRQSSLLLYFFFLVITINIK
ncbi:hypothetical protein F2Q69_00015037 [Brassica cretica]|uniref:Uncharacterized protein n=1 Tax=Brassica cretica TaxID=69181 RepID=A0A8S9R319_BRACR|nr:hypothetical protein F2Q69_00015037 [Brassica cretica]